MVQEYETSSSYSDVAALMQSRATMYGLLGRMFEREVNEVFLGQLRTMHYPQNSENALFNEAFRRLYGFLRHAREDVLDVLAIDYARAFLGSGVLNGNAAFPYESVYTSEHALLMQEARDEVLAIYRANGMQIHKDWNDPEDHIALELEFMRLMCSRTSKALEEDSPAGTTEALIAVQYSFLVLHLLRWAERFCADVRRFAETDFYHAAAQLMETFLVDDRALLEDIAQASNIDLGTALETAQAADAAVTAAMIAEAEKDHTVPNVVMSADEEGNLIALPFSSDAFSAAESAESLRVQTQTAGKLSEASAKEGE